MWTYTVYHNATVNELIYLLNVLVSVFFLIYNIKSGFIHLC